MNDVLDDIVKQLADPRITFVDPTNQFAAEGELFCPNDDVIEPQRDAEQRELLLFAQYNAREGSLQPDGDDPFTKMPIANRSDAAERLEIREAMIGFVNQGEKPNADFLEIKLEHFDGKPEDLPQDSESDLTAEFLPLILLRIFHPSRRGHQFMADAVSQAIETLASVAPTVATSTEAVVSASAAPPAVQSPFGSGLDCVEAQDVIQFVVSRRERQVMPTLVEQ